MSRGGKTSFQYERERKALMPVVEWLARQHQKMAAGAKMAGPVTAHRCAFELGMKTDRVIELLETPAAMEIGVGLDACDGDPNIYVVAHGPTCGCRRCCEERLASGEGDDRDGEEEASLRQILDGLPAASRIAELAEIVADTKRKCKDRGQDEELVQDLSDIVRILRVAAKAGKEVER